MQLHVNLNLAKHLIGREVIYPPTHLENGYTGYWVSHLEGNNMLQCWGNLLSALCFCSMWTRTIKQGAFIILFKHLIRWVYFTLRPHTPIHYTNWVYHIVVVSLWISESPVSLHIICFFTACFLPVKRVWKYWLAFCLYMKTELTECHRNCHWPTLFVHCRLAV